MSSESVKYCQTVSLEINFSEAETAAVKPNIITLLIPAEVTLDARMPC